jgi:hypothetical protein
MATESVVGRLGEWSVLDEPFLVSLGPKGIAEVVQVVGCHFLSCPFLAVIF